MEGISCVTLFSGVHRSPLHFLCQFGQNQQALQAGHGPLELLEGFSVPDLISLSEVLIN
jgi:hypothetical protein